MWTLYAWLTTALGGHRRLIRRVAALCLILMGVHAAADHLDDQLYGLIDALDLVVDDSVSALLAWLAEQGGMTPADALARSESFALWIDLPQKDRMAIVLALAVEGVVDALLFGFAWGRHEESTTPGFLGELKDSARQLVQALAPLDLERLAVVPTTLAFSFLGSLSGAVAAEQVMRALLSRFAPDFLWGSSLAATLAILGGCLLVWRFVPDLLHGALLRSQLRGARARERAQAQLDAARLDPHPLRGRVRRALVLTRVALRGLWLLVLALPLAVTGILSSDVAALVARAIPTPGDTW